MEGLGEKFQKARAARNLTLEEAARMTKIRPAKLAEIEAEDFSQFPSLAYAKGFVLIYGKFLGIDVTPYLEGFETSERVTVDGYSYLQENPAPAPRRSEIIPQRSSSGNRSSLMPLIIGVVVLVAGFTLLKFMMDVRRLKPSAERDAQALAQSSMLPAATPAGVIAPRALPADSTPAPTAPQIAAAVTTAPRPVTTPLPTVAGATLEEEPEVRRAEPVHPEDLAKARAALAQPTSEQPTPAPLNRFEIRPLTKTFVRVTVDQATGPSLERWLNVSEGPVQFQGKRIAVKLLDPTAVEIRKNGKVITSGDIDVRLE